MDILTHVLYHAFREGVTYTGKKAKEAYQAIKEDYNSAETSKKKTKKKKY